MAPKLWLVLALIYIADCRIIKTKKENVPAEGMVVEVIIKSNSDRVALKDSVGQRVYRGTDRIVKPLVAADQSKKTDDQTVDIGNRFGIRGGVCPAGYVKAGGFCFPDYE